MKIAKAAAHAIKANELFLSAKLVLDAANVPADQGVLLGITAENAALLYTLVTGAVSNSNTLRTEMKRIDAGVDVG